MIFEYGSIVTQPINLSQSVLFFDHKMAQQRTHIVPSMESIDKHMS
jgi:hypothetical protein